jgi:hypothetical protein
MLATVAWIGSLVAMAVPCCRPPSDVERLDQLSLIDMQQRLEPITWFSVSVLVATGLFQMSVNPLQWVFHERAVVSGHARQTRRWNPDRDQRRSYVDVASAAEPCRRTSSSSRVERLQRRDALLRASLY